MRHSRELSAEHFLSLCVGLVALSTGLSWLLSDSDQVLRVEVEVFLEDAANILLF